MKFVHVAGDGIVFRSSFWSPQDVQDNGGVITAANVSRGLSPSTGTGATSRVAWNGTESLLINASKMTLAFKLKASNLAAVTYQTILAKCPNALNDNQFLLQMYEVGGVFRPLLYIASSAADTANSAYTASVAAGSEHVFHAVYDGTLAAGSRVIWYTDGLASGTSISGTIPTSMRASAAKLGCPNYNDGTNYGLGTGGVLYWTRIWDRALSALDVAQDYADTTNRLITP